MATTTRKTNATTSYTQIATSGAWLSFQNTGNCDINVIIQAAIPGDNDRGFKLKPLDMALPTTFGDDNVWILSRSTTLPANVTVSE